MNSIYSTLIAVALFTLSSGCASTEILSTVQTDKPIFIDADPEEWLGLFSSYEEAKIQMASSSDDAFLYLALHVTDRSVIQSIMGSGIVLSFSTPEKSFEPWALKYPLGVRDVAGAGQGRQGGARGGTGQAGQAGRSGPDERVLTEITQHLDVIYEQDKPIRIPVESTGRFEAAASYDYGALTVEWKIPFESLSQSDIAFSVNELHTLSLNLATPQFDGAEGRGQGGAQAGGGARAGGQRAGGGRGARGGQGQGPRGAQTPLNLDLEIIIQQN